MKNMKYQVISILVISIVVSAAWALSRAEAENAAITQTNKLFVTSEQGQEINVQAMKKSLNLYQNLSEDKKAAIKEKMAQLKQERQKDIERVEKQIKEYRLQIIKKQNTTSQEARISQLQALKQLALKENAPETAKKIDNLISKYENNKASESLGNDSLQVQ
ncbi:MAG: hypothetical protein JW787_02100 [Sedimentisphaerales bacterium]|nr:hypothetical protein [Sedimentisphaerales bacterium]